MPHLTKQVNLSVHINQRIDSTDENLLSEDEISENENNEK